MVHQQYIGRITQVLLMWLRLKELQLESKSFILKSCILQEQFDNGIFVPKYENISVITEDVCTKLCSVTIIS